MRPAPDHSHSLEDALHQIGNTLANGVGSLVIFGLALAFGEAWGSLLRTPDAGVGALWELLLAGGACLAAALTVGLALQGGGAQLMRAVPCSGGETFRYLSNQIVRPRIFGGLFFAGLTFGLADDLVRIESVDHRLLVLSVVVAGALAYYLLESLAWLFVIAAGRRAPQLVAAGFVAFIGAVAAMGGQSLFAARLQASGWTATLFRALPAHWPMVGLEHAIHQEWPPALIWLVISIVALALLRGAILHWLGEPFRRAVVCGAEPGTSPQRTGEAIDPDWIESRGFSLPRALWIAARTAGAHADALPRRLACGLLAWVVLVLPCWTFLLTGRHTSAPEWREIHTVWLFVGVIGSLLSLVKWHSIALPTDEAARLERWGHAYPSWSMLPLRPWRTAFLRFLGALSVASSALVVLAPIFAWRVLERAELRFEHIVTIGLFALIGVGILTSVAVASVAFHTVPAWWRARQPALRVLGVFGGGLLFVVPVILVTTGASGQSAAVYLTCAVALGALLASVRLWSIDRWAGNDVIEVARPPGQGRGR